LSTKNSNSNFFKLKEICQIGGGNPKLNKRYLSKYPGLYPVYDNSKDNIATGYWNEYAYNLQEAIYFTTNTAKKQAGKFFYLQNQKFSLYVNAKLLNNFKKDVNLKYLYLYLIQIEIIFYLTASQRQLRKIEAYDLDIFLPSIPIQNYFVDLLWFLEEDFKSLKIKITNLKQQLKEFKRKVLRYCFFHYFNSKNNPNLKLENKLIKDVCLVNRGEIKNKKYCLQNPGIYPLYSSKTIGDHVFAMINSYQYDGTYIWFTNYGAYLGSFYYVKNTKFSLTNIASLIQIKKQFLNSLNLKYLYYYLWMKQKKIKYLLSVGAAIPRINTSDFINYPIIIPDLATQDKIIQFLNCYDCIDNIILKLDNFLNSYVNYKITILRILLATLEQSS